MEEKYDIRMEQSRNLMKFGCFGVVIIGIIFVLIGGQAVRNDIQSKQNKALTDLGRMKEQIDKTPVIFKRMINLGCDDSLNKVVDGLKAEIETISSEMTYQKIETTWSKVNDVWLEIETGCAKLSSEPAFRDLVTEMEGVRNRYAVESGNFKKSSAEYESSLKTFFGQLFGAGFPAHL